MSTVSTGSTGTDTSTVDRLSTRKVPSGLAHLKAGEHFVALRHYARMLVQGRILTLTLEVTKRCNAKCDFCDHWREPKQPEDVDFVSVVRKFDPLSVLFCGGEPLVRRDIEDLVRRVVKSCGWRHYRLITNGWLLTPELGMRIYEAGLHQIDVSLNWPDERQDEERKLRGLFGRIEGATRALARCGVPVTLNAMMMRDNLEELVGIAQLATDWNATVSYTLYSEHCNGNTSHQFTPEDVPHMRSIIDRLMDHKRKHNNIVNSDFYLLSCPDFIAGTPMKSCIAGKKAVHVSPQGMVKPCADLPVVCHYSEFDHRKYSGPSCEVCWMACRGEAQAPVSLKRIREMVGF